MSDSVNHILGEGIHQNLSTKLDAPGGGITCPWCKMIMDRMSTSTGKTDIAHLAMAVCAQCGEISWYDARKKSLHQASQDDLQFLIDKNVLLAHQVTMMQSASMKIKQAVALGQDASIPKIMSELEAELN